MNQIDTLILSGGGPSGIAYIGIFNALFEKNILTRDLSGIQEIITTSAGILFSILYMLNIKENIIENFILNLDLLSFLNTDNLEINDLLIHFGLFNNHKIGETIESFIRHTLHIENITLKEFYEKIPILLTVKVFNVTKKQIEYISYQTNPDLKLSLLSEMTTAIPFFFKPVQYNDCLYVDGGLRGHFPIENNKSENYLGLFVLGGSIPKESNLLISGVANVSPFGIIYMLYYFNESRCDCAISRKSCSCASLSNTIANATLVFLTSVPPDS